jgi:hypothetical protein
MPIASIIEQTKDLQGVVMETTTWQDVTDFEASAGARSYRKVTQDGVVQIVEEVLIEQGAPQFSFDGSVSTDPLETHPRYSDPTEGIPSAIQEKWLRWKKNPSDAGLDGWKPEDEANARFAEFYGYFTKGVEVFFSPRVTARVTVLESGAPDLLNLGKLDVWGGGWPAGFTVPEGVNFLLSGVRSQQEGEFFRTTYEYMSSAPGGWSMIIYL